MIIYLQPLITLFGIFLGLYGTFVSVKSTIKVGPTKLINQLVSKVLWIEKINQKEVEDTYGLYFEFQSGFIILVSSFVLQAVSLFYLDQIALTKASILSVSIILMFYICSYIALDKLLIRLQLIYIKKQTYKFIEKYRAMNIIVDHDGNEINDL